MTIREINELRKSGKLQEALEAAEHEFSLNQNNYTASALFWCLYDISKQESDQNSLSSLYERMKSLHEDYCSVDEYMPKSLTAIERRIDPISKEIKDALEKAKNSSLTTEVIQKCQKLFVDKALNKIYYPDFGWLIYYNLKNTPLNEASKRKQLLHSYLQLELPRPNLLHSLILGEAVKIEKNTPLQFRIRDFMLIWGWENFMEDDWKQYLTEKGHKPSRVERLIAVYAKELITDGIESPKEFTELVDKALDRFSNNQYLPLYKAQVLKSLEQLEKAVNYYRDLILKSPSKAFLWNQAAEIVEDINLEIALLCKAISVEKDEAFIGGVRLNLISSLIENGSLGQAKFELERYENFYRSKNWSLKQDFHELVSKIPADVISENTDSLYSQSFPLADEFIYGNIPSDFAIKISDKQIEDKKHPGKKLIQWTLRTRNGIFRLLKPNKFGLDKKEKNGTPFDIKIDNGKIVWIRKSQSEPLQQDWIKKAEGTIEIRTDRKGNPYAILDRIYIGKQYISGIDDGESARIIAVKQEDNRWSAIALTKI